MVNRDNPEITAPLIGGENDIDRGAPKVYTDALTYVSEDPVGDEVWESKDCAKIRKEVYKNYISRPQTSGNTVEGKYTENIYNMLMSCVGDEQNFYNVDKVKID